MVGNDIVSSNSKRDHRKITERSRRDHSTELLGAKLVLSVQKEGRSQRDHGEITERSQPDLKGGINILVSTAREITERSQRDHREITARSCWGQS